MKKIKYIHRHRVIGQLVEGGSIYTFKQRRGTVWVRRYELYDEDLRLIGWIHHITIKSLIDNRVIYRNLKLR